MPYLEAHQTREHEPTPYAWKLAGALEEVFATGAHELPQLIEGLHGLGMTAPDGQPLTEVNFLAEMRRLGGMTEWR